LIYRANVDVSCKVVSLDAARKINGLRAVFGEEYPDPVRVVSVGASVDSVMESPELERWRSNSIEFCGGTHLSNTRDAEAFVILGETLMRYERYFSFKKIS